MTTRNSSLRQPCRPRVGRRSATVLLLAAAVAAGCAPGAGLGPRDGRDLPPADTGRVAVGDPAPDFALRSYAGPVVALSDFRGRKDVILVFYRGYW
jgi:hypothetical protein